MGIPNFDDIVEKIMSLFGVWDSAEDEEQKHDSSANQPEVESDT